VTWRIGYFALATKTLQDLIVILILRTCEIILLKS
jgi:hypothetical protein